jgi:hypothetical protein
MDAINRAGIDGLLNPFKAVAVLTYYPRSAPIWLHQKGITCHMGAIPTTNTNLFINPNRLLAQAAPQPWPGAASGGAAKAIEGSIFKATRGLSTLPAGNYQLDAAIGTYLLFSHNKTLSGSAIEDAVQGITLG